MVWREHLVIRNVIWNVLGKHLLVVSAHEHTLLLGREHFLRLLLLRRWLHRIPRIEQRGDRMWIMNDGVPVLMFLLLGEHVVDDFVRVEV